jgi:hypothetical protein
MYTELKDINFDYLKGVKFNRNKVSFTHENEHIEPGGIVTEGNYKFYAEPYSIAYTEKGLIALYAMDNISESYIGKTPDMNGGYLYHYLHKSLRIVKDENEQIIFEGVEWKVGDNTEQGKIIKLGNEYAVVEDKGIEKSVYKASLRPVRNVDDSKLLNEAIIRYRDLVEEVEENAERQFSVRLEKSLFDSFKNAFKSKPKKSEIPPPAATENMNNTGSGKHTLHSVNFDINSPTRKSYTYKGPQNQLYTSPHYLNEQGQKTIEPDHVKNMKVFAPGQGVMHQGQPHTIHQVGREHMAIKDITGKIKTVKAGDLEHNPNHSFDPFKEPIVKTFNIPEANRFNFNTAQVPKGENKFLKDVKEGSFVEFPESHPEAADFKKKYNSNIARVARVNPISGKVLLSSPITNKNYQLFTAEGKHFNKASEKLENEYSGISQNVKTENTAAHEYLSSFKTSAAANNSTIAEEIAKERERLNSIKEKYNTGEGRNLQELGDAVKKLKMLDEYQGVKKVFSTNQTILGAGSPQHDKFLDKVKDVEGQGLKKAGEGTDYRVPFKHNLFDFDLTFNAHSGNINTTIKNAQKFKIGKKDAEIIHYNPLEHKVTVKIGDSDIHKVMPLEDLKNLPGVSSSMSGFARNYQEFNNPIAGEKENYSKGSFQHKEFENKVNELKNNPSFKHIEQDSNEHEHSFHHEMFGRLKLRYNDKTGQRMIEFSDPKEFKIGGSTYVPTAIDPYDNKITFHQAGKSWTKKYSTADISDIEKDIKTTERLKGQPKKSKIEAIAEDTSSDKKMKVKEASETFKNKLFGNMYNAGIEHTDSEGIKKHIQEGGYDENLKGTMDKLHSELNESNPIHSIQDVFDSDDAIGKEYQDYTRNRKAKEKIEKEKEEEKIRTAQERSKALEQSHEFQQNKGYVGNYKKLSYLKDKEHTIEGKSTKLRLKDAEYDNYPAKFHIINLDDAIPSHIPSLKDQPFEKNPAYPEGVQAKSYHENNETASSFRKYVHSVAKDFNPEEVLNAGIQGNDNTPVADKKGLILGGNTRTMGSKLHDSDTIEKRRQQIISKIDDFVETKSPEEKEKIIEQIKKNPNPFVLRVVDHDLSEGEKPEEVNDNFKNYNRLSAVLNSSQNAEISNEDLKKTNIQKIADLIPHIAGTIGSRNTTQLGTDDTKKIKDIIGERFKNDQLAKYFQGNTITDEGHSFLRGILSANAIDNEKTRKILEKHPLGQSIINNINNAPMWNHIQNITKEPSNQVYSLQKDLDKTIAELKNRSKKKADDIPESMFETPLRQRVLFDILSDESGTKLNDFTEKYHGFIQRQSENSDTEALFAMGSPEEMIDRFYQKFEKDNPSKFHLQKLKDANKNKNISSLLKKKAEQTLKPQKEEAGISKIPPLDKFMEEINKWNKPESISESYLKSWKQEHKKRIKNDMAKGLTIPDEVIKDHPDLIKKPKTKKNERTPIDSIEKGKADVEDELLRNVDKKFKAMKPNERRALIYKQGNIIPHADGKNFDKVLSYSEGDQPHQWHVTVQKIDKDGKILDGPRTHSTEPQDKHIKNTIKQKIKSGELKIRKK